MKPNQLKYAPGSRKKRKKIARGTGSGHGGTSTRGHKGAKSRSGASSPVWFEGGQMPIQRRLPKVGFHNLFRKSFQVVNLEKLNQFADVKKIDAAFLVSKGLIKRQDQPIKILGSGTCKVTVEVEADAFSASAKKKIEAAGGKVVTKAPKVKMKRAKKPAGKGGQK